MEAYHNRLVKLKNTMPEYEFFSKNRFNIDIRQLRAQQNMENCDKGVPKESKY